MAPPPVEDAPQALPVDAHTPGELGDGDAAAPARLLHPRGYEVDVPHGFPAAPSPSRAASFSKEPSDRQCSMRQASREAVFPSTPASSRSPSKKRWRPSVRRAIRSPSGVRRPVVAAVDPSPQRHPRGHAGHLLYLAVSISPGVERDRVFFRTHADSNPDRTRSNFLSAPPP